MCGVSFFVVVCDEICCRIVYGSWFMMKRDDVCCMFDDVDDGVCFDDDNDL